MRGVKKTLKSCDFCVKRRRHCDGFGLGPCSFCITKNQPECRYRERCSSRPGSAAARRRAETMEVTRVFRCGDVTKNGATPSEARELGDHEGGAAVSLKRVHWSPSPATGLVGTQENSFLDDFFTCYGFLPFASQSTIRQAIVSVMLAASSPEQPQEQDLSWPDTTGTLFGGPGNFFSQGASLFGVSSSPANVCTLWCAIGLGALVRGLPLEKVMDYMTLASRSLAGPSPAITADSARAYVAMGLLHSYFGQEMMSSEYLALAANIVHLLPSEESTLGLLDMVKGAERARLLRGVWIDGNELDAFCKDDILLPKSAKVVSEGDLCKVLLAVDYRLTQTTLMDMMAYENFWGGASKSTTGEGGMTECERYSEIPIYGEATRNLVRGVMVDFASLSGVVEMSGTFAGLGGLVFASNLLVMKVVEDDFLGVAPFFQLKIDIYLRFPGLMRDHYRLHDVHNVMASAMAYGLTDIYERLRAVHNGLGIVGYPKAPPAEGWQGLREFCGHALCRFHGELLHSLMSKGVQCPDKPGLHSFPDFSRVGGEDQGAGRRMPVALSSRPDG